jgi:hypothetical protein
VATCSNAVRGVEDKPGTFLMWYDTSSTVPGQSGTTLLIGAIFERWFWLDIPFAVCAAAHRRRLPIIVDRIKANGRALSTSQIGGVYASHAMGERLRKKKVVSETEYERKAMSRPGSSQRSATELLRG